MSENATALLLQHVLPTPTVFKEVDWGNYTFVAWFMILLGVVIIARGVTGFLRRRDAISKNQ